MAYCLPGGCCLLKGSSIVKQLHSYSVAPNIQEILDQNIASGESGSRMKVFPRFFCDRLPCGFFFLTIPFSASISLFPSRSTLTGEEVAKCEFSEPLSQKYTALRSCRNPPSDSIHNLSSPSFSVSFSPL